MTRKAYDKEYYARNREHIKLRVKKWKAKNPDNVRAYYQRNKKKIIAKNWRYLYGVSPEQVAAQLEVQEGACAICRSTTPGGKGYWHIDHDHATGVFRGMLCHYCNIGLGVFKDNPQALRQAAVYLTKQP